MPAPLETVALAHPSLTTPARAVYAALVGQDPADPYTTPRLVAATGLHRATIHDAARELEVLGLVRLNRSPGRTNTYAAIMPSVAA